MKDGNSTNRGWPVNNRQVGPGASLSTAPDESPTSPSREAGCEPRCDSRRNVDLQAAATRYKRRASALRVASIFETFYAREEWPKGDALYQELLQADEQVAAGYAAHEYKILAYRMKDPGRAAAFGRRAAATFLKADRGMLVRLAEMVLDPKLDLQPRDLDLARLCAERADALAGESNASTAATLARVCSAQGEWTRTIDAQRRAVRLADPHDRAELQKTLDEYLAAAGKAR